MENIERALALGAVLKRIGKFNIDTFDGRIVLQKRIYLLQSFGLYLGYKFSWYVHGPYSPELTKEAFKIEPIYEHIPEAKFATLQAEQRFLRYLEFLGEKKNDADWLEQLACIHFLKSLNPKASKHEIIKIVLNHETHFNSDQCQAAWSHLVKYGLIKE